jgi:hypothetical protein
VNDECHGPIAGFSLTLAQLLSLAALTTTHHVAMDPTCEFAEIIRRRRARRRTTRERLAAEDAGLRGLVRVLLANSIRPHTERTYRPE